MIQPITDFSKALPNVPAPDLLISAMFSEGHLDSLCCVAIHRVYGLNNIEYPKIFVDDYHLLSVITNLLV